jgi:hypothetical protein
MEVEKFTLAAVPGTYLAHASTSPSHAQVLV